MRMRVERGSQVFSRDGSFGINNFFNTSFGNNLTAQPACSRPHINDMICPEYHFPLMFHCYHCITSLDKLS